MKEEAKQEDIKLRLGQIIPNAGYYLTLGLLQQINISRVLLSRPRLIMWINAASSLDETTELEVIDSLQRELPKVLIESLRQRCWLFPRNSRQALAWIESCTCRMVESRNTAHRDNYSIRKRKTHSERWSIEDIQFRTC